MIRILKVEVKSSGSVKKGLGGFLLEFLTASNCVTIDKKNIDNRLHYARRHSYDLAGVGC